MTDLSKIRQLLQFKMSDTRDILADLVDILDPPEPEWDSAKTGDAYRKVGCTAEVYYFIGVHPFFKEKAVFNAGKGGRASETLFKKDMTRIYLP
jgi:hypothetical protein